MKRFMDAWSTCVMLQVFFTTISTMSGLHSYNIKDSHSQSNKTHIIVVVPTIKDEHEHCSASQPMWERGEKILMGANVAMKGINTHLNLPNELEIVSVKVPECSVNTRIDDFIGHLTLGKIEPVAIVGYFCDNVAHFFSQLADHESFGVAQIFASLPLLPHSSRSMSLQNLYHLLPSSAVCTKAAALFIKRLQWDQIGVIGKGGYHDMHFSRMREEFLHNTRMHDIETVFQIEKNLANSAKQIIKGLKHSTAKVIVVFLPPSEAADLLCESFHQELKWPRYIWIYMEVNHDEMIRVIARRCQEDVVAQAMERVIFVHFEDWQKHDNETFQSGEPYTIFYDVYTELQKDSPNSSCLEINPYASVVYDSIWAIALAMNSILSLEIGGRSNGRGIIERELAHVSFQGVTGLVNFSRTGAAVQLPVSISQTQQFVPIQIGLYDSSSNELVLNKTRLGDIPSDDLDHEYLLYPLYLTVILLIFMTLSLIFTTIIMSLFIHYRKNPEIKAASSILSLCMFIGCYCLILSSIIHTVSSGLVVENTILRYSECWGNTFLFTVGLDAVLATVIAKALRIYHIFHSFNLRRLSPAWSDKCLFVAILAIVSVKVLLMVIWASVDINHLVDERRLSLQDFPPHYVIIQKCYSRYLSLWVGLAFGYTGILFIPMIVAAILTRKIKGERFKDSKKICALVAVLCVLICVGNSLWFFLRAIEENIGSKVVYSLGFTLAALACQVFLFLPKIVPSLRRHADILKPTWVDTSINYSSCDLHYAHGDHHYHRLY